MSEQIGLGWWQLLWLAYALAGLLWLRPLWLASAMALAGGGAMAAAMAGYSMALSVVR